MRFPGSQDRISIVGATGSGKTLAAKWHLSGMDYDSMPWLIYDFKGDPSVNTIPYARHIEVDEIPVKPGIYITHPLPHQVGPQGSGEVEVQLWEIWKLGNTGVYVDEGYMMGRANPPFRALLTQGRTKQIPMITLSQRPVYMDGFVFSESGFFQIFRLHQPRDIKAVNEWVRFKNPSERKHFEAMPEFHSYYFSVKDNEGQFLSPVPGDNKINEIFATRLKPVRRVL
jgi:hypothetical protein